MFKRFVAELNASELKMLQEILTKGRGLGASHFPVAQRMTPVALAPHMFTQIQLL